MTHPDEVILRAACRRAGLDHRGASVLHRGENTLYQLPGSVVARLGRLGQQQAATTEVTLARWLNARDVPVIVPVEHVEQPVIIEKRPVTFWQRLPPHRHARPRHVAQVLRVLHALPVDGIDLPRLDPFVRLDARIDTATVTEPVRDWMRQHLAGLRARYDQLPPGLPHCVVHGDAWVGNVAHTDDDTLILLDLERASIGPPEWDLVHMANERHSFGWLTAADYADYVADYGLDVTGWPGYPTLRDIREFRQVLYAWQAAATNPTHLQQAQYRLSCVRGERGERPWRGWFTVDNPAHTPETSTKTSQELECQAATDVT